MLKDCDLCRYTFLAIIVITTTYVDLQAKEIGFMSDILFFIKIILKKH